MVRVKNFRIDQASIRRGALFLVNVGTPIIVGTVRDEPRAALLGAIVGMLLSFADNDGALPGRLRLLLLARIVGLLLWCERLAADGRLVILAVVKRVVGVIAALLRLLLIERRLGLPKVFLRGGDQAKVMLGVLIIILGGYRVARRACVARQLHVFFRNVGSSASDLDVRSVGFKYPGHRVLAAPVVIVIPVTHPLVILTVSHVVPLFQP